MEGGDVFSKNKPHRAPQKGKKGERKRNKDKPNLDNVDPRIRNPKAFAITGAVRAERRFRRNQDFETKKERVPRVDRTPVEPPPFIIAIVGPPKVGKSTLFRNLIKNFTRQTLSEIKGPVTIVSGKKRRLTLMECNNDINSMIDVAKVADLVLLLIDASFGFEMEVFEFLNICQVHGFPQIMGVLTHLDVIKNKNQLKKVKKTLKHRFWTEVYPGSKLFYLSGYYPNNDAYPKNEIHNLSRFVSVMKFRPTQWRSEHSHVLVDRMEDLTSLEAIRVNAKVDRTVSVYGYVHGTFLKPHVSVHIPGLGDYTPQAITELPDPCPLPMKERTFKRTLNEKEKVMYAPFCGVGGIVYDKDAVYIDLGGSHSHSRKDKDRDDESGKPSDSNPFVDELRELTTTLDAKIESAGLKIFSESAEINVAEMEMDYPDVTEEDDESNDEDSSPIKSRNYTVVHSEDGRVRRKVVFEGEKRALGDDVTEEIQAELESLKSSVDVQKMPKSKLHEDEDENEEQDSDDDDDESDSDTSIEDQSDVKIKTEKKQKTRVSVESTKTKNKAPESETDDDENEDISEEIAAETGKLKTSVKESHVKQSDSSSDSSDEEVDGELVERGTQKKRTKSLKTLDLENSDEEGVEEDAESEEDEIVVDHNASNTLESEKEARIEKAETAFYSRFRSRSLQKMIYDPAEDYMNVTSRADFDHANAAIREDAGVVDTEELKDLFIGGDYAETAKQLLDAEDNEDEDDFFGDFEMLDDEDSEKPTTVDKKPKNEEERQELKKKLKEKFNMDYDDGKDGNNFYQEWKAVMEEQSKSNRQFFEDIDDPKLLQELRGFCPGTYVRIEIGGVPCEFVLKFEPQARCPLIVGSVDAPNQETLAVVQARIKKHRWHPKILKSRDPVIMSVGWRRFQTIALYSVHDHNMRNRMIKYTPEHLHCIANFYGPMTPQGTGILGIAPRGFDGFRITMTGTILDMDKSAELVKKLKLVGNPSQVFKKSAFVQGMFNSRLEVAKFIGAKIKTVSGIRGVVKRPLQAPPGAFRATFEDKILMSDIVFCRTWVNVDIPKFFLNIANYVDDKPRLLKTVGQLKREAGVQVAPNPDNLYTGVERETRTFRPLKVPKGLQAKLPYKEKPKIQAKENAPQRIAVIKEPHERKMTKFLNTLKSRLSEKEQREKDDKSMKHAVRTKKLKKVEEQMTKRQKELRKKVFKTLEKMNKNKTPAGVGGGNPKYRNKRRK
ncbi:Ribosome biogenesis protein bms1 [Orchesella cincta]|uniref:Ribosome biogenesis protein bms1 n=1 Tax=Orchesella cincta TaxID=48709 RepID=A0A1D2MJU2_ORCCI|nr:Ribosome biogenesis protein bms1 [Orchesella cincta]